MTNLRDTNDDFSKDTEVFRNLLVNIVKNVADAVTEFDGKNDLSLKRGTTKDLRKEIVNSIENKIDLWIKIEQKKFDYLNVLLDKAGEDPAWRPTTGQIPLTTLKGKYTQKKKLMLTNKLNELRKERLKLQNEIIHSRKIVEKQLKEMQKCQNSVIRKYVKVDENLLEDH